MALGFVLRRSGLSFLASGSATPGARQGRGAAVAVSLRLGVWSQHRWALVEAWDCW